MLLRITVTVCFTLLLLFPLVERVTHIFPDAALQENRMPAPMPDWKQFTLQKYLMGWQSWFNDCYSGRNFLIRLKTQIDYSVFSYSDKVYIGRNGWLFYRSVVDVGEPAVEQLSETDYDHIVKNFADLNAWLAKRGIHLIIVENELKDAFYAEELPFSAPKRPLKYHYRHLSERLARETGASYIDSSAILSALKDERPIFHKTDFHWNDPAAFAVARAVVDQIAKQAGPPYRGWRWPLQITYAPNSGGEATFMPLFIPVTETSLFVKKTWPDYSRDYRSPDGPFEFSITHKVIDPTLLPGIVVFGDSFFDGMLRSGFAEHFQSIHRARIYHSTLDQVLTALPSTTRFFLVQFIEPASRSFTMPVSSMIQTSHDSKH